MMRVAAGLVVGLGVVLVGCQQQPGTTATENAAQSSARSDVQQESRAPNRSGENDGFATGNEQRRDNSRHGARSAAPGQFDFYLLTLSWSPEFCFTHPDKAECALHARFVVHGLWPENNDGSFPDHCSNAPGPANPGSFSDLYPDQGLLQHEWQTHGTCSGMNAEDYFNTIRRVARGVKIPAALATVNSRVSMTPDQIVSGFVQANAGTSAEEYALGCGNNFLTQMQACLDKNLKPTACLGVRSCRANVVKITPPGAMRGQ